VIAPRSTHISGRAYTWTRLEIGNLSEAPASWLERLITVTGTGSKLDTKLRQGVPQFRNTICNIFPLHARSIVPIHAMPKTEKRQSKRNTICNILLPVTGSKAGHSSHEPVPRPQLPAVT
jgi:hypothetical protein